MNLDAVVLPEPLLKFAYGQSVEDPHHGLELFGPSDLHLPSHPAKISYVVVGTSEGIKSFLKFAAAWTGPLIPGEEFKNENIWPAFPGFEAVFQSEWPALPTKTFELDAEKLMEACGLSDIHDRVGKVSDIFLEGVKFISKSDEKIDVVICVAPDFVFKHCRPQSTRMKPLQTHGRGGYRRKGAEQLSAYADFAPDFRRQLKARTMEFNIPIQIVRESTMALTEEELNLVRQKQKRGLTPASDRAWNLGTTIFYKAGGKPWTLASVRDGVCYIGIAYRMTGATGPGSKSACCAAQMFLQDGDGVIFRGEDEGIWYSPDDKTFHLKPEAAQKLLAGVLDSYKALGGKPLKEVFLHCASGITAEEYEGFKRACPAGADLVTVRVKRESSIKLFRKGSWPVVRGTFWKTSPTSGILWASGFKFQMSTYDGTEIPVPVSIDVQHGNAEIEKVAYDILGLTKLNYNACKFGEAEPVTICFSDAVGEILISNPGTKPHPQFKFYI